MAARAGADRRRGGRRQDLRYGARIEDLVDGAQTACMILDVSQTGARLQLREAGEVPREVGTEFLLRLAPGRQAQRHCAVVWRDGLMLGVRFLVAPEPAF